MPDNGLPLNVTIPAHEWEAAKRRVRYLEAAIAQLARPGYRLREWFTASDLADMRLPHLPTTRHGVIQRADREGWPCRVVPAPSGERYEFHFSALPRPAFDDILRRVLDLPEGTANVMHEDKPAKASSPAPREATPQWLLPLLRVVRAHPKGDAATILRELPNVLPAGSALPTLHEVSEVIRQRSRGR